MEKIGESLRQTRMEKGLTLEQIESGTNIRRRYLEAMENEDWKKLPEDVYIKSFLRTYCRYLGLDEKEYLDYFNKEFKPEVEPEVKPIKQEFEMPVLPRRKTGFILGIIAIILLFGISYFYRNYLLPLDEIKKPSVIDNTKIPDKPNVDEDPQKIPSVTQPEAITLFFKCLGECWVEVKDGNNKKIYEGIMVKDQELQFDKLQKVSFVLGNAGQMQVMLNGEDLGTLGKFVVKKTYIFENNEVKEVTAKKPKQPVQPKPNEQKPIQEKKPISEQPEQPEQPVRQKLAQ